MDWAALAAVVSALAVGGGLAWKIATDREAQRRARVPDVEVQIEAFVKWASPQDRTVRVAVINHGDFNVRVIEVGCREAPAVQLPATSASRLRPPPPRRPPRQWSIREEQVADLPRDVPPRDGQRFTVPTPVKALSAGDLEAAKWPNLLGTPQYLEMMTAARSRSSGSSITAWAKISTGHRSYSPRYPTRQRPVAPTYRRRSPRSRG
jgi:hypothetical protein